MVSNQIHALVQWYPILSPSAHAHLVSYLTPCTPQPGRCCLFSWLCCIACGNLSSLTRDQTCALGSRGWNPNRGPPGGSQVLCPLRTAHGAVTTLPPSVAVLSHGRSVHLPVMLKPRLTYYCAHNRKPHVLYTGGRKLKEVF